MIRSVLPILLLAFFAREAQGDLFPCSEAGLNSAIAEAGLGNSGPHALDCSPGDFFQTVTGFGIGNDLTLDGRGVTIECYRESVQAQGCRQSIVMVRELLCSRYVCGENIWGPPPNVTLENFNLVGTGAFTGYVFLIVNGIQFNYAANLVLKRISFASNSGAAARAIEMSPGLTAGPELPQLSLIESSVVGAISISSGSAIIERSLVQGGSQVWDGISVFSSGGLQVRNSTVHGAIWNGGSTVDITNSTLIAGENSIGGLGIAYQDGVLLSTGLSSTICSAGDATFSNTIVSGACQAAASLNREFCSVESFPAPGSLTSLGGNLESPEDYCLFTDATDQVNIPEGGLGLLPLGDYFGPTMTHALLNAAPPYIAGSPAVDAAVPGNCPLVDQRGAPRPETGGTSCDSGAFEAPEPAASMMLIAGILMLLGLARRRRSTI